MTANGINLILAFAPPAEGMKSTAPPWAGIVPVVLMFGVLYIVFIRPQTKKNQQHEQMLKALRAGDKVTTNSGIIGVVVSVKDRSVTIRTADTKLELLKSAVVDIDRTAEPEPPAKSK